MKKILNKLTKPKSKNEDSRRSEFILNVLLISLIGLLSVALIGNLVERLSSNFNPENSLSESIIVGIWLFFVALYFLSRKGYFKFSAYIFILLFSFLSFYMIYLWGIEVQAPLLFFSLLIVLSGVLISTRFAFLLTFIYFIFLVSAFHFQQQALFKPDLCWKEDPWGIMEISVVSVLFLVMATVSWLSNRETEKSLKRARRSEKALAKERDLLEIRVEERTRELQKTQMEKLDNLTKMAEFGNISGGLFHDFVGPLTALSLNIEELKQTKSQKEKIKNHLKQASLATKKMTKLIDSFRKQTSDHNLKRIFSINKEIKEAINLLNFQAKNNNVQIILEEKSKIKTFGNPIKFSQIMANLISNAIDSYQKKSKQKVNQKVFIILKKTKNNIQIIVKNNGNGIPKNIQKKIFDPFFTTKKFGKGSGVGLSLSKKIIEKEFNGNIELKSKPKKGAVFTIRFKQKNETKRRTKS